MKWICFILTIFSVLSVVECFLGIENPDVTLVRSRRAANNRVFVIGRSVTGDLFSIAPVPPDLSMVFQWASTAPDGFLLNSASGMISRDASVQLGVANFTFSISRSSTASGGTFAVKMLKIII